LIAKNSKLSRIVHIFLKKENKLNYLLLECFFGKEILLASKTWHHSRTSQLNEIEEILLLLKKLIRNYDNYIE